MRSAILEHDDTPHAADQLAYMRDLVLKHKICWEVWPEFYQDGKGKRLQIGFELDLIGTHYNPSHLPSPGCDECYKVYNVLWEIAEWLLPQDKRQSRYDVQIFDQALRYTPSRKFRPEVTLRLKILHAQGFDRAVSACELRCLKEMKEKLRVIGALEGKWQPSNFSDASRSKEVL